MPETKYNKDRKHLIYREGEKRCSFCKKWKGLDAFHKSNYSYSNRQSRCKVCTKECDHKRHQKEGRRPSKFELKRATYLCPKCKKYKSISKFKLNDNGRRKAKCATCISAIDRALKNRPKVFTIGLKNKQNSMLRRYILYISRNRYSCYICKKPDPRVLEPEGAIYLSNLMHYALPKLKKILDSSNIICRNCARVVHNSRIIGLFETVSNNFILGSHPDKKTRRGKNAARDRIADVLSGYVDFESFNALTLPGPWCIFEKELREYFDAYAKQGVVIPFIFTGVEHDENHYSEMITNLPIGGSPLLRNVDDYLLERNLRGVRYNFIWLDYQGMLTEKRIKVLKNLYRWMDVETIVVLTFLQSREHKNVQEIQNGNRIECLEKKVPEWIGDCEHLDTLKYKDGVEMVQTIYRIDSTR